MGYTTKFIGKLKINKKLDDSAVLEIKKLNQYNPYEKEEYEPDKPKSYCQWIVDGDRKHLKWDGEEKFSYYIEWLEYVVDNVLSPRGYVLSGELIAEGENIRFDLSKIIVEDNKIRRKIFGKRKILKYLKDHGLEWKKVVVKVFCSGEAAIFHHHISNKENRPAIWLHSLNEFIFRRFFKRQAYRPLLVAKGKEIPMSLIECDDDGEKKKISKKNTLSLHEDYISFYPVSTITEIVHYKSPLFRFFLRSDKVYCICVVDEDFSKKLLCLVKNDKIIRKIVKCKKNDDASFKVNESRDFYLVYFLFKKLVLALVMALITVMAILFSFAIIIGAWQNPSNIVLVIALFMVGAIDVFCYLVVYKVLWQIFSYFYPNRIFRAKTVSNTIDGGRSRRKVNINRE